MIKKISILFLLLLLGTGTFVYLKFKTTPTTIYPYPFVVAASKVADRVKIQESDILIIGDRLGSSLNKYLPGINESISKNLRNPLKIYNWSAEGEGLHRTLKKLKSLKKIPSMVLYFGGSEEFLEERFLTRDRQIFEANFKIFKDDRYSSILMSFPWTSKFLYKAPSKYFYLKKEIKAFKKASSSKVSQLRAEYIYKYYQLQLEELSSFMREKGSTLVFVTAPINLEVAPRIVCDNSITNTIMIEQNDIDKLLKKGQSKEALARLKMLAGQSFGNATTYFQLGRAYLLQGNIKEAKKNLLLASAFDCGNWRGNPIFNKILKNHATKNDISLVDFAIIVESGLARNITFVDDIFPQSIYYDKLKAELILVIKQIFKI
ncbi:hypothetical protein A9Q84_12795 [Halobacteriovorax marinus]|uniref:Tetratricopeptide repeat protein n=1 Tax=Halobacteriovorax marinus TaxID=97084 RepID=A0A1Y5F8H2_9BACT|nr:hypothetical protein A9Q84_12795 [Halobacteriovorax marinus]